MKGKKRMENGFMMRRRVEFMDTDMAGIVHFTAYFRYMETIEHELFRTLGLSITTQQGDRRLGWPRVSCGFDFIDSLRFDEEFEIHFGVDISVWPALVRVPLHTRHK
jgi:YbgC/YbaW family acyl-CoA thioester hydrolase